jgi:cholesterol transport system auxiliary component
MFQRLLADTISARGARLILNDSQDVTSTGEVLTGELLAFGVDADHNQAVVTYQALRLSGDGGVIVQRRFEAREAISLVDASSTGTALNRAANRVATEVAGWMEAP